MQTVCQITPKIQSFFSLSQRHFLEISSKSVHYFSSVGQTDRQTEHGKSNVLERDNETSISFILCIIWYDFYILQWKSAAALGQTD